jgi:hypothetical protein
MACSRYGRDDNCIQNVVTKPHGRPGYKRKVNIKMELAEIWLKV